MGEKNWVPSLQRFQGFLDLLQNSLQATAEEPAVEISAEQWVYVVVQIRKSLVRFTLAYRECPESEDDCEPFLEMLNENLLNFVSLYQFFTAKATETLCKQFHLLGSKLITQLRNLTVELIIENKKLEKKRKKNPKASLEVKNSPVDRVFGVIEECCGELQTMPLTNLQIAVNRFDYFSKLVKDALNETTANLNAPPVEETVEPDDDFEDDFNFTFDEQAKKVLPFCIVLIKASGGSILNILKLLKQIKPNEKLMISDKVQEEKQISEFFESIVQQAEEVQSKVDEVGSSIYPPQDYDFILQCGTELNDSIQKLLDLCIAQEFPYFIELKNSVTKLKGVISNLTNPALTSLQELAAENEKKEEN